MVTRRHQILKTYITSFIYILALTGNLTQLSFVKFLTLRLGNCEIFITFALRNFVLCRFNDTENKIKYGISVILGIYSLF